MKKTNYVLHKEKSGSFTVLNNNKVCSKGFNDIESALHSVWVLNGKNQNHFYKQRDGKVFLAYRVPIRSAS